MKTKIIKKVAAAAAAIISVTVVLTGCTDSKSPQSSSISGSDSLISNIDVSIAAEDLDVGYDEESTVSISFSNGKAEISGEGAAAQGENVTISQAGTYILSGTADNGRIIVDSDKNAEIKLVFNGVKITCSNNAPIFVSKAKKVYVVLNDGTENTLSDGDSYSSGQDDANTDGCVFSKADLTINGGGTLNVKANYKHGIVSKDDLVITDGTINVTSASTALEGKDCVKISGGTFKLSAGSNGIKSTNTEDSDKGFISITGGNFNIVSNNDAIEAEKVITVEDGSFDITTGGGSSNASMKSDGTPNGDWRSDMGKGGGGPRGDMMSPNNGGNPPEQPDVNNGEIPATNVAFSQTASEESDETSTSAKAIKAGSEIKISGGKIKIDSADDSLHCNGNITISGGSITASSGDDGIHAGNNLTISNGEINIDKSYEGMEGSVVKIDGGTIKVTASDDGINCAGGSDTGSADRPGADQFAAQEGVSLNINGGTVTVNADGDGLDSNGDLYLTGGVVYVSGPTNGGNGALDYNGEAKATGGTLIACGAVGMEEGFGESSTQNCVLHDFSSTISANESIKITDSSGNTVLTFTPSKDWQSAVFTSPELKKGETYTITAGSVSEEVTINGVITSNSTGNGFGGGRGGNRF
ncbi:MAG: carbohydrate-binding domain-containing protein [Oscillospiraceae bacterium]